MRKGFALLTTLSLCLGAVLPGAAFGATRYDQVKAFLRKVVQDNPSRAQLFTLGDSDSGEKIEGVRIGDGPVHNLVVGTHHGNEYGSTEVAKGVAKAFAEQPLKGQTVFVIPVLNISGYNANSRYERAAGQSFDPNRNYPGPCGTEGPFTLKSTQALANFVAEQNIVASATLHTFHPAVMYPWGISTHDLSTAYDDIFKMLVQSAVVESGYQTGNSTAVLYPADGTYEDYAFWKHGIWSILYELGYSHTPSDSQVAEMVRVNVPGIRRQLEQSPRQRAENHVFAGRCDTRLMSLDRHDE